MTNNNSKLKTMIKYIYIFLFWIGIYTAVAQEDTLYVQQAQKVKDLHQRQLKTYTWNYIVNAQYAIYQGGKQRKIFYPDRQTFKVKRDLAFIYGDYQEKLAFDKNGVYYKGYFFPSDTASFQILDCMQGTYYEGDYILTEANSYVWKTDNGVYLDTEKIEGADPGTFMTIFSKSHFRYMDKNAFYSRIEYTTEEGRKAYKIRKAGDVDKSIRLKNEKKSSHRERSFHKKEKEYPQGFDRETFVRLSSFFGVTFYKDKNLVYIHQEGKYTPVKGYDVASLQPAFLDCFFTDKDNVYYNTTQLIASKQAELLAVYPGDRRGWCGNDTTVETNYYLFKNSEGYWLVKIGGGAFVEFLETEYNLPINQ